MVRDGSYLVGRTGPNLVDQDGSYLVGGDRPNPVDRDGSYLVGQAGPNLVGLDGYSLLDQEGSNQFVSELHQVRGESLDQAMYPDPLDPGVDCTQVLQIPVAYPNRTMVYFYPTPYSTMWVRTGPTQWIKMDPAYWIRMDPTIWTKRDSV